ERLLDTFDEWALGHARDAGIGPSERFEPTRVPASSRLDLDLRSGEIRSILWATGFRPDYPWLQVPVLDGKGQSQPDGGVVVDLSKPTDRPGSERRGGAGDGRLGGDLGSGDPAIQRVDQLVKLTRQAAARHRHLRPPLRSVLQRALFHTSPHDAHRQ